MKLSIVPVFPCYSCIPGNCHDVESKFWNEIGMFIIENFIQDMLKAGLYNYNARNVTNKYQYLMKMRGKICLCFRNVCFNKR